MYGSVSCDLTIDPRLAAAFCAIASVLSNCNNFLSACSAATFVKLFCKARVAIESYSSFQISKQADIGEIMGKETMFNLKESDEMSLHTPVLASPCSALTKFAVRSAFSTV